MCKSSRIYKLLYNERELKYVCLYSFVCGEDGPVSTSVECGCCELFDKMITVVTVIIC